MSERPMHPDGLEPEHGEETLDKVNSELHYNLFAIFKTSEALSLELNGEQVESELMERIAAAGADVRGFYDIAGYRSDSDLMVWITGNTGDAVQDAYRAILSSTIGKFLTPIWSVVGMHRVSEFNKSHLPGYLVADGPEAYLSIYPFVRSYDWYYMDPKKRAQILRDHGMTGRPYKDIISSTVATFSLSDYEWIVALESPNPERLVDLMRDMRNTEARLYVREDTPFFTGKRMPLAEWIARQPSL